MRRVLMLGTYPIEPPRHGGQRRGHAIAARYRSCGWEVKHIGVFRAGAYAVEGVKSEHLEFSKEFVRDMAREQLRPDLHVSEFFTRYPQQLDKLITKLEAFDPHVIQFEQPWVFPALADYLQASGHRYRLIYSSQNIEHKLLHDMLVTEGSENVAVYSKAAECMERRLAAVANATICVTEADAAVIRSWGARRVTVARNGADRRPPGAAPALESSLAGVPFAVVAGSAHPPNCTGFVEMLGTYFAFVPPHAKLVVSGGMAGLMVSSPEFDGSRCMLSRRVMLVEEPSEAELNYLINAASVVMLPITQGGGSNIKTAEALLTSRPVVGTSAAFRGFELFRKSNGVSICDQGAEFRHEVREALSSDRRRVAHRPEAGVLVWEECVSALPDLLEEVLADGDPVPRPIM
jgi:glycosyltransferase involved in cell wall biosynthesis